MRGDLCESGARTLCRVIDSCLVFDVVEEMTSSYGYLLQVTAAISANRPGCTVPCLGLAWSNLVTTRIILRKSDRTVKDAASNSFVVRTFEVAFSPDQPFDTAEYIITENGVCDAAI